MRDKAKEKSTKLNRRDFVKASAVVSLAILAFGCGCVSATRTDKAKMRPAKCGAGTAMHSKAASALKVTPAYFPLPDQWRWQFDAPFQLKVPAVCVDWQPTELQPLPASAVEGGRSKTIILVPYGCTKFRVSMFPVTKRSRRLDQARPDNRK
jgi:hypothetical protein